MGICSKWVREGYLGLRRFLCAFGDKLKKYPLTDRDNCQRKIKVEKGEEEKADIENMQMI